MNWRGNWTGHESPNQIEGGNVRRILFFIFLIGFLLYAPRQPNAESSEINTTPRKPDSTLQAVRERGRLIAGVLNHEPPFGFVDKNGALKGIDIDIGAALARKIFGKEDRIEFIQATPVERWMDFLKSNRVDILLAPLFINAERKKEIDFSIPCFVSGYLILVNRDGKITNYQDLAGKSVATIRGTVGSRILEELVPTSKRVQFQHNSEALQALKEQKVDAFWQLDVFLFYMAEKDKSLKVADLQPIHPSSIGLGVRKGDKEWRDFVDIALLEMMTSGEYRKVLDKWFGRVRGEFLELALRREIKSK